MGSTSISPTLPNAYCQTTHDALVVFEAVLQRKIFPVSRRPHDRERSEIVQSGNIFIFNETESGIKRWTDGVPWSPSRILGNFLIYRELSQPFPPGEKKRAQKRMNSAALSPDNSITGGPPGDFDRQLVGSLVDSYNFKRNGLVKKTISVTADNGRQYHMISYYNPQDVLDGRLRRPSLIETLEGINPRPALISQSNFRVNSDQDPQTPVDGGFNDQGYNINNQHVNMRHPSFSHHHNPGYMPPQGHHFTHSPMDYSPQVSVSDHFGRDDHPHFGPPSDSQPRYRPSFGDNLQPQVSASGITMPTIANSTSEAYSSGNWSSSQGSLPPLNTSLNGSTITTGPFNDSANYTQLPTSAVNRPSGTSYGTASPSWVSQGSYPPSGNGASGRTTFNENFQSSYRAPQEDSDPSNQHYHPQWSTQAPSS